MNKIIVSVIAIPALALSVAACGPKSGTASSAASSAKASASAFANSPQGRQEKAQAEALVKKCLPASEAKQLELAEPGKGKANRQAAEACLAIPKGQQRTLFDEALLGAAVNGHLKTKAGRAQFPVTVAELVLSYKGKP